MRAPSPVAEVFCEGKQALRGAHRELVECWNPYRFSGSIDLDTALSRTHSQAPRWDYGLRITRGEGEAAIWVEVHTATTGEVKRVLEKLAWLKNWLRDEAPALHSLSREQAFGTYHWVSTEAGTHIPANSPQARRLAQAGLLLPRRRLIVKGGS